MGLLIMSVGEMDESICHLRSFPILIPLIAIFIPPQTLFVVGYTVFTLSVRPSVCPSVTLCFFSNIWKTQ